MPHISPTNLLLLAAKQEPYKKVYLLMKNTEEFSGNVQENGPAVRQKIRREDSAVKSNDSPEIPDRKETSDIPHPLWGQKSLNR